MATRTPGASAAFPNGQARQQYARNWGTYASLATLPNASGNALTTAHFVLEAGDEAYVTGFGPYVCTSPGTAGGADAAWQSAAFVLTGNTLWVDAVNGVDASAARGSFVRPYLTVAAALAAALAGDVVFVRPGTYNLSAGITVPTGVTLMGQSHSASILRMSAVAANTTMLTMGEGSSVSELAIQLSSNGHFTLVGVYWPGTTVGTAQMANCRISVDNSGAGAGASIVTGVLFRSAGISNVTDELTNCSISVNSVGTGRKRGILMDSLAGEVHASNLDVRIDSTASVDCIGVEVNVAGGLFQFVTGIVSQTPAAATNGDISQTAGALRIGTVQLVEGTCLERYFQSLIFGPVLTFGDDGALTNGVRYLRPGTAQSTNVQANAQIPVAIQRPRIVKSLSLHAGTAPGGTDACVVTVMVNGTPSPLTVTITGTQVSAVDSTHAAQFPVGSLLSVQTNETGSTADVIVTIEYF